METQEARISGSELALELGVPLAAPDALAKRLFEVPVFQLTRGQLESLVELLSSDEWVTLT